MPTLIIIVPIVIVIVALALLLIAGYVKASPDEALIISGLHERPRVLIGRAGFKVPFFERVDRLCLKQISVDIKTDQYIPTNDFINVKVDAVAKIRVTDDPDGMLLAERNFLNMDERAIAYSLQDSLQGNMREIIGTLDLRSINTDRDSFSDQVLAKASRDMEKLGIEILSCNIQNVTDEHGLITDLGMDNTSKIKKDAAIAKAQAEKEVAIAQAHAEREANDQRVQADTDIAEKQNALAIQRAGLKTREDTERAKADAAYAIQEQEQQKVIQAAMVNAQIAKAEREAELREREVQVREQELAATIRKQAEAEKYRTEQDAEAALEQRKRQAEADRYAAEQEAEATRLRAEAQARATRIQGEAEAEAIRAKGEADAAALEKRALALHKMNQAGMAEMMIKIMPEVAAAVAQPLSSIGNVSIYDAGGSGEGGVSRMSAQMPVVIRQVFDTMSEATGVDMREIMRASTYDATVNRNVHVEAEGLVPGASDEAAERPTA
ncbi:MAG: flotillin family protein [Atopobiaceae bacterium]|nr:flotillin family protein [Atopobiaceae bacterium]